jgi:hypothetical protein
MCRFHPGGWKTVDRGERRAACCTICRSYRLRVDPTGDDTESHVAVRLRALEAKISTSPAVVSTVLTLSAPDEPTLVV